LTIIDRGILRDYWQQLTVTPMDTLLEERVELRSIEGEIDQQGSADVYVSVHVSKNNESLLASVLPSAPLQVRTSDHPP